MSTFDIIIDYPDETGVTKFFGSSIATDQLTINITVTDDDTSLNETIYAVFQPRGGGAAFFVEPTTANPQTTDFVIQVDTNVLTDLQGYLCEIKRYPDASNVVTIARGVIDIKAGAEYPTSTLSGSITPI